MKAELGQGGPPKELAGGDAKDAQREGSRHA